MTIKIRKIISVITSLCLLFIITIPVSAQESDISKHWARSTFERWTSEGLLKGYADGSYKPNNIVTKAEILTFIDRIFKYTDTSDNISKDVAPASWYEGYISRALAAGITQNDVNGNIEPQKAIARGDVAVIIAKAFNLVAASTDSVKKYNDYESIPAESRDAIAALTEKGFVKGNADKSFGYTKLVTRAEAITMINNAMGAIIKSSGIYKNSVTGNLVINAKDVVLKDITIGGDLYLTQGIGQGDVTLENVKVTGKTYVFGGGVNSVKIKDSTLTGTLILLKKDGKLRVVAQGSTEISDTQLYSGAVIEEESLTGKGFVNMTIMQINPDSNVIKLSGDFNNIVAKDKGTDIQLLAGSAKALTVFENASGSKLYVAVTFIITEITANTGLSVSGTGKITNAKVTVSGVVFEQIPTNLNLTAGITVIISGSAISTSYSNMGPSGSTGSTGSTGNTGNINPAVTPAPTTAPTSIPTTSPTPTTAAPTPTTAAPTPTETPASISGIISFAQTPENITVTNIQLKQDGANAGPAVHPDNTGAYSITGVAAGNYTIEVSLEGYKSFTTESFEYSGTVITGKNITLIKSTPSPDGKLLVSPYMATPGETKHIMIIYTTGEKLNDGTVVFNLPAEFKATTGDMVKIGTGSAVVTRHLTESEISSEGNIITVTNVTSSGLNEHEYLSLALFNRVIPNTGIYNFNAKTDSDGTKTDKSFSSGKGLESGDLFAGFHPVSDFQAVAQDSAIHFTFSPSPDATSVELLIATVNTNFSPVPGVVLTPQSSSADVTGLVNGKFYLFKLVVKGGSHNGIAYSELISPTKVDPKQSTAEIDKPLMVNTDGTFNYSSIIKITFKDAAGNPICNASESFELGITDTYSNTNKVVLINGGESLCDPSYTGSFDAYMSSIPLGADGNVTINVALKAPATSLYNVIVYIVDLNGNVICKFSVSN